MALHSGSTGLLLIILLLSGRSCRAEGNVLHIGGCPLVAGGSCPDPRVRFLLFTSYNQTEGELLDAGEFAGNLSTTLFDSTLPTKVLMHGYNSGMDVLLVIKDAYLSQGYYNVIMLDWNQLSLGPCYFTAVFNARFAGKCAAQLVQRVREAGVEDIHLVGFSLGAHVASFTANHLRPYKLPRITGLDPAMPLFVTVSRDGKLDASDALFVDVMHTNAFFQGKAERSGQVDFYMNGGVNQPGCLNESSPLGCDHHRAVAYFSESIVSRAGFWGWSCGGLIQYALGLCPPRGVPVQIGEFVDRSAIGFHISKTSSEAPFALGKWTSSGADKLRYTVDSSEGCSILNAVWGSRTSVVQM